MIKNHDGKLFDGEIKTVLSKLDVKLYFEIRYEFMTISSTFISSTRRFRRLNLITNPAGLVECRKSMIVLCFVFLLLLFYFLFIFFILVPIFPLATSSMTPTYFRHGLQRHQSSRMLFRFTLGFILVLDVQQLRALIYNIIL